MLSGSHGKFQRFRKEKEAGVSLWLQKTPARSSSSPKDLFSMSRSLGTGAAPAGKKWGGHASGASKKWGSGGLSPENFLGPRPPERRKTPLMQDRIKILFIIDFTFWTLFASHNSLQTTNEKEKS